MIVALALANAIFVGVWLTRLFLNLEGTWRAGAETTAAYLDLALERRKAAVRWSTFLTRTLYVLGGAGLVFMTWMIGAHWAIYSKEPYRAVIGVGGFAVILAGLAVYNARKGKSVRAELDAVSAARAAFGRE